MKNISTPPPLPTFTVLTLLDLHGLSYIPIEFEMPTFNVLTLLDWRGLSYGQLAQLLKVSRQAIAQAVKGIDDFSRIRGGVAKLLGIKPSILWAGVFNAEKKEFLDMKKDYVCTKGLGNITRHDFSGFLAVTEVQYANL